MIRAWHLLVLCLVSCAASSNGKSAGVGAGGSAGTSTGGTAGAGATGGQMDAGSDAPIGQPGASLGDFELTFYWVTTEDEFSGPKDTDLFDSTTIERMIGNTVLNTVLNGPCAPFVTKRSISSLDWGFPGSMT